MTAQNKRFRGFTLVELLIVIAVIGVLAVVVLVAINPVQQLARARDAGRVSAVTQLGHAVEANFAANSNGQYLTAAAAWITALVNAGEINVAPALIAYSAPGVGTRPAGAACNVNMQNNYCYNTYGTGSRAIVYARLESAAAQAKCTTAANAGWVVYSTADGKAGTLCTADAATQPWDPTAAGYGTSLL